ncbi:MAG: response regulator transcription factor [Gemmatimonadetes bacterium]|nr:response regulator transcription factor [Gemmatimonadota bacterium]
MKTVTTYRTRILEKTRLKSNAEIIRYAVDHGLVP